MNRIALVFVLGFALATFGCQNRSAPARLRTAPHVFKFTEIQSCEEVADVSNAFKDLKVGSNIDVVKTRLEFTESGWQFSLPHGSRRKEYVTKVDPNAGKALLFYHDDKKVTRIIVTSAVPFDPNQFQVEVNQPERLPRYRYKEPDMGLYWGPPGE